MCLMYLLQFCKYFGEISDFFLNPLGLLFIAVPLKPGSSCLIYYRPVRGKQIKVTKILKSTSRKSVILDSLRPKREISITSGAAVLFPFRYRVQLL